MCQASHFARHKFVFLTTHIPLQKLRKFQSPRYIYRVRGLIWILCLGQYLVSFTLYAQETFNRYDSLRGSLSKYRTCYDVTFYDLNLTVQPDDKYIEGYNAIHYEVIKDFDTLQLDLFNNYIIDSLTYNDRQIRYRTDSNTIFVLFDDDHQRKGGKGVIKVYYSGYPAVAVHPPWDGGFVWERDKNGRHWVGVTCEGIGASLWWPNKDHLSDEPDSMGIHITIPEDLFCVSNGTLRSINELPGLRTFNWFVHYPINNYNVTLNIANYTEIKDQYLATDEEKMDLNFYVLDYNLEKAQQHFRQVKPMLRCYENLFGKYPFWKDGYALVETPYWGMEHQGAVAYGNEYQNNAFDFDFIIVHESGHEYWGNSISCTDHAELWIHEAFTTYTEALYLECMYDKRKSIDYLKTQQTRIKNTEPLVGPLDVNYHNFGTADMYYKGTWMLHTLRHAMNNDSLWFGILKQLATDYQYGSIRTEEVIEYFNIRTSVDVRPIFLHYLYKTDIPRLILEIKKITKKKTSIRYRFDNVDDGFELPIELYMTNGQILHKRAGNSWKEMVVKKGRLEDINRELIYVEVVMKISE